MKYCDYYWPLLLQLHRLIGAYYYVEALLPTYLFYQYLTDLWSIVLEGEKKIYYETCNKGKMEEKETDRQREQQGLGAGVVMVGIIVPFGEQLLMTWFGLEPPTSRSQVHRGKNIDNHPERIGKNIALVL